MDKKISIKEFVEAGYLLEVNRQFLHRLGLALAVVKDNNTDEYALDSIWDNRDDPEGFVFAELDELDRSRIERVANELAEKDATRLEKFGWVVQEWQ